MIITDYRINNADGQELAIKRINDGLNVQVTIEDRSGPDGIGACKTIVLNKDEFSDFISIVWGGF